MQLRAFEGVGDGIADKQAETDHNAPNSIPDRDIGCPIRGRRNRSKMNRDGTTLAAYHLMPLRQPQGLWAMT
jgi:hypothetical protein